MTAPNTDRATGQRSFKPALQMRLQAAVDCGSGVVAWTDLCDLHGLHCQGGQASARQRHQRLLVTGSGGYAIGCDAVGACGPALLDQDGGHGDRNVGRVAADQHQRARCATTRCTGVRCLR
jgi:hypothetical protein